MDHRERFRVDRIPGIVALAAILFLTPGLAAAQFSADISPNPVVLRAGGDAAAVLVTTQSTPPFQDPITYSFTGFPPGISTGGSQVVVFPYNPASFSFAAGATVARGIYTGSLVGTTPGGSQSFPMTVVVERPDFSLSVEPTSLSLPPGGSAAVRVGVVPIDGFTGVASVTAPSIPGVAFTPSAFDLGVIGSRTVTVTADPVAAPGTRSGAFRGTARDIPGQRTAALTVQVTEGPPPPPPPPPPAMDFSLGVSPSSLTLAPGEGWVVDVSAIGIGGFTGTIEVSTSPPAALAVQPSVFTLLPGTARAVSVTADVSVPAGTVALAFSGTANGIGGSRRATATIVIRPQAPVIHSITPPAVVTGTTGNVLRVTGERFDPAATLTSASPGVVVSGSRILGPGAAEVVVSVRPDAAPGPYQLELVNPDGGRATGGAMLLVYPAGALSAPLAVTAAAIVTPRPWQILEAGEPHYPRALLATSGMGTIVGTWLLDGVPFDRFTRVVSSGYPVEVRSAIPIPLSFTGEHRLELAIESPASLPLQRVPYLQAVDSRSELRVLTPEPGARLDPGAPSFRWTLVPGASGYEVEIRDTAEETSNGSVPDGMVAPTIVRRRVTGTEWRPEQALFRALGPEPWLFRVRAIFPGEVAGQATPWQPFVLRSREDEASAGVDETSRPDVPLRLASTVLHPSTAEAARPRDDPAGEEGGEVALTLQSTTTTIGSEFEDPPPLTRLLLSAQTDFRASVFDQQATSDLAGSHDLEDPWHAREESRNWLTRFGATEGGFRQEASIGFAPPSFFDQTEFLTVATSGGGLQGTLGSPLGRLSYYRSVDLSANGAFATFEPDIDAAAYEASDDSGRFLFRAMALDVVDPEVEGFSAGGEGRAVGVIGVANPSPYLRILGEAAGGEFDPGEGSFEEGRDGRAFRLYVNGAAGTFGYAFVVGRTGEGFVNPANRGFTPGGVSDRTRAELTLQKGFGRVALSGAYSHVRGGIYEGAGDPGTTENSARVQLLVPVGERVSLFAAGNVVGQRGDPLDEVGLPGTDRTQKGLDLTLSETWGPFSLNQAVTWQDFTDEFQPLSDQEVLGLSFAANGAVAPFLNLAANLSTTRTEAAPEIGTTSQVLVSLQPALTIHALWLAVTPRSAWSRVTNDLDDSEFKSDQYQTVVRWSPPWLGALLDLELSSDWNRSWSNFDPSPPPFDRQTVLTLILNWGLDRGWGVIEPVLAETAGLALHRSRAPGHRY